MPPLHRCVEEGWVEFLAGDHAAQALSSSMDGDSKLRRCGGGAVSAETRLHALPLAVSEFATQAKECFIDLCECPGVIVL
jgi:hypothetical protein